MIHICTYRSILNFKKIAEKWFNQVKNNVLKVQTNLKMAKKNGSFIELHCAKINWVAMFDGTSEWEFGNFWGNWYRLRQKKKEARYCFFAKGININFID